MGTPETEGPPLAEVTIPARFNGPPDSANGGYACGALARFLTEPAEVTLRMPPPLGRPLSVHRAAAGADHDVELRDGDDLLGTARELAALDADPPVRPSFEEAVAAAEQHPYRGQRKPLSDCFVCSPWREDSDGLGVCFGPLAGADGIGAAPFIADESVRSDQDPSLVAAEIVWAVLDCPSFTPSLWPGGSYLLGRFAAAREREIAVGEQLAAVGWDLGSERRKHFTASALIDADGEVVARATATWIALKDPLPSP